MRHVVLSRGPPSKNSSHQGGWGLRAGLVLIGVSVGEAASHDGGAQWSSAAALSRAQTFEGAVALVRRAAEAVAAGADRWAGSSRLVRLVFQDRGWVTEFLWNDSLGRQEQRRQRAQFSAVQPAGAAAGRSSTGGGQPGGMRLRARGASTYMASTDTAANAPPVTAPARTRADSTTVVYRGVPSAWR